MSNENELNVISDTYTYLNILNCGRTLFSEAITQIPHTVMVSKVQSTFEYSGTSP